MVALLAIWAVPFTRATGGRGVHNELLFTAALLLLLPAVRVWRAPTRSIVLASVTSCAALLVCVFSPSHWYGSDVAVGYGIAAACYLACRRYVRDAERRTLIAAAICLAGLYQFSLAFTAWWGSRDPTAEMSGSFYWHNPYAAFLLPGAIIGIGLVLTRQAPWSIVGWVSTPLCSAGIVFSSSRATMAPALVGIALVVGLGVRSRRALARAAGVLGLSAGVILVLPGPPFFSHYSAPWAATTARATGQSLARNGGFRTEFWREAFDVAVHHPLVGSGFHTLATASAFYTPGNWARSPQAHDGYLQALSDGGLLLGVPFLCAVAVVAFWGLRVMWSAMPFRAAESRPDLVLLAMAVALLGGLAHSAVDFDWSHPSILVQAGLLAACVAPAALETGRAALRWRLPALAVLAATLAVMLPALHEWQINQPNLQHSTDALLADGGGPFGDFRPAKALLSDAAHLGRSLTLPQARQALAQTASEARVDIHLALLRDAIGAQSGLIPDAASAARVELRHVDGSMAPYVPDLALVLIDVGDEQAAARLLRADIEDQSAQGGASPDLPGEMQLWAQRLGTDGAYACVLAVAQPLFDAEGEVIELPTPTAACPAGDQGHA